MHVLVSLHRQIVKQLDPYITDLSLKLLHDINLICFIIHPHTHCSRVTYSTGNRERGDISYTRPQIRYYWFATHDVHDDS